MGTLQDFFRRQQQRKSPQTLYGNYETLSDPESLVNPKLELAETTDVGQHFVKATYFLEGDGPLVFSCYEKLKAVAEVFQVPYFPNVRAVVAAIVNEDPNQRAATLEQRAKACVQPAIQCFLRKFNVDLYDAVTAFKAARVMCPATVGWLRPTGASVEALRIFPFLDNEATIDGLVRGCHSTSLLLRMWLLI